ncbi:MAG: hypothetical protein KC609_11520 [Myxococcales bacterium]|nr:hypothetical protein [Myxococcales bacterium]
MRTRWYLETQLYGAQGFLPGAEDFVERFRAARIGPTSAFVFDREEELADAIAALAQEGIEGEPFYVFELDDAEVAEYPALYFGIERVDGLIGPRGVDCLRFDRFDIAQDRDTRAIITTAQIRRLLEGMSVGLEWQSIAATDGRMLVHLRVANELPEAIFVPLAVGLGPASGESASSEAVGPTSAQAASADEPDAAAGEWMVRSDGRDVISHNCIQFLRRVGLALSTTVRIGERVHRWRPRLVASGAVLHALRSTNVRGLIAPPTPLLAESHPLASVRGVGL